MTPVEMLAAADVPPVGRYWLGETFEDLRLDDVSIRSSGEIRWLDVEYRGSSSACVTIELGATAHANPDASATSSQTSGALARYRMPVLDGQAAIYESPVQEIPIALYQGGSGTPRDLPSPRDPVGSTWWAAVELPDAVVRISTFCTSPTANPYNSLEGVQRIASALVPFRD